MDNTAPYGVDNTRGGCGCGCDCGCGGGSAGGDSACGDIPFVVPW